MSLATRCPACSTTFKVVSDQLKIQRGMVKCGQCGEIFDGIEHMRYISKTRTAAPVHPAIAPASSPLPAPIDISGADPHQEENNVVDTPNHNDDETETPAPAHTPQRHFFFKILRSVKKHGWRTNHSAPTHQPAEPSAFKADKQTDTETHLPSFMLAHPSHPSLVTRLWWSCWLLMLTLLLLLQLTYWYRHEIVAYTEPYIPSIATLMQQTCQALPIPADCTIKLPRHIERLKLTTAEVIETDTPGLYSLQVGLRNESSLRQAYPALDVTLSDARNHIVARRILLPHEYSASAQEGLPSLSDRSLILSIRIESENNAVAPIRIAGYLVEIFYP
jgi:predicted Zn finger-like uncharacterized protein